ncbi:MAG TPA: cytochrome b5 [Deltaproteobacteria bacterium]|nr:cytochrome b5 [Deltaproteobacteria bacterium]
MKEIDPKELESNNGQNGKPIWVAHDGKVFDLSESGLWEGGLHMGSHSAGADLTEELAAAPHGPEMLERYKQIGYLTSAVNPPDEQPSENVLAEDMPPHPTGSSLLTRFPVLRRHPHPMTVHFPIVFGISVPVFTLLYLISHVTGFEITAFYCLGAGILTTPVAMATGYITWRINYGGRPLRPVSIKKPLSVILLCVYLAAFIWRAAVPGILTPITGASFVYLVLVLILIPLVTMLGWYGASLTFPLPRKKG